MSESNISNRMDEVEKVLTSLDKKINKIYDVVCGDERFGQDGIINRLQKLEKEGEKNKELKNKLIGAFIVGGIIWTFIAELIKKSLLNF
jgi:hypothetical protein